MSRWLAALAALALAAPAGAQVLVRGPYLQQGTPQGMVVRWRTDVATDTELRLGPSPTSLGVTISDPTPVTEHEVPLGDLAPYTRYYYAVGTSTATLAGADANHFFVTSPLPGTRQPIRIWVIGDSGFANATARNVRDAYLAFAGSRLGNVWLMLGDNAYNNGTDAEYTAAVFGTYPQVLRNTVLWPAPGNHEFGASDSPTQTGPYFVAFTLPKLAEAGGVPSGTEAYYSYDYGNVHFIVLDSHDTDRSVGGAMYQWLEADLQQTEQDWIVAYWHHPPYSYGGHLSDNEAQLIEMRQNFVPLLESYGVDVQLTGHSHSYERSKLIDGHYGNSLTFSDALHAIDAGSGNPALGSPYLKPSFGIAPHEGAVYSVVGSSSATTPVVRHPAMVVALSLAGSMVIDVNGDRLDARWIDQTGVLHDRFVIDKGPPGPPCADGIDNDGDGLVDAPADPGCLNVLAMSSENPACDNGIDDDVDGLVDFPADPQCSAAWIESEAPPASACGLGAELALITPLLAALARRGSRLCR